MSISKQLINGFIKSELELFRKQFDESLVPEIQETRSLAIAWLCYFFKNSVSSDNSSAIIQFVDYVDSKENYNTHGWYRISALQAASFILNADPSFAASLIQHIDCGQGWARGFVLESASIICPLLSFDNEQLKKATETNMKYCHGLYEENVLLYLSTKGRGEEKLKWLEDQISLDEKDHHRKFLIGLKADGGLNKSGFFVRSFNKAKSYLIFKLLSHPFREEVQPELFDNVEISFKELTYREEKHPLNDYYIDLSFLAKKK
ncbi:MAG TPA: hypothetical protein PKG57_08045 [Flavobacteriales bacterium]|nr:hypothetical protein [Flavobacteriales bacterium]